MVTGSSGLGEVPSMENVKQPHHDLQMVTRLTQMKLQVLFRKVFLPSAGWDSVLGAILVWYLRRL